MRRCRSCATAAAGATPIVTAPTTRLDGDQLFERLTNWSPIVRERAADALARRKEVAVEPLIAMLDAPKLEARIGACQALEKLRGRAAPAVPKLRETLKADDLWLRVKAADAWRRSASRRWSRHLSCCRCSSRGRPQTIPAAWSSAT